ncbi:Kunitz/Bovine pancreatic trypsin inhibitor domain protein [Ostertagia ostertagi]
MKGYYETVQCDSNGCFCVAAHNGFTAFDTYTSNNKTQPKCSGRLSQRFEETIRRMEVCLREPSSQNAMLFWATTNHYSVMRKRKWCYCVDTKTGEEVPKTRTKKEGTDTIKCGKTNYTISQEFLYDSNFGQKSYPVSKETCMMDRSKGVACKEKKPSVRYYFDYSTSSCLAFEYLGCGGNGNNYNDSSTCIHDCLLGFSGPTPPPYVGPKLTDGCPVNHKCLNKGFISLCCNNHNEVDGSGCSGMNPPARLSNGEAINCNTPQLSFPPGFSGPTPPPYVGPKLTDGCPVNHKCLNKGFISLCCNNHNEDRFHAAYNPKCKNGKEPYSVPVDSWKEVRFGKSCKDNFCPKDYKCHDAEIFAYCCKST